MQQEYRVFVVPHTHWDRAWYVSFEEFRLRLVRLVDRVCDQLEKDPRFTVFCLDGQTVVLEDYLAVRQGERERLKRLVQAGRLAVGPWYVLPDEFLVSGEALVRNLMLGHAMSAEFGHTMQVGYVPDSFGHIAQLPQILAGFGLKAFLFSRGIDTARSDLKPEFTWRAPDGSTVLALHQRFFYNNAAFLGYRIVWGDAEQMVFDKALAMKQVAEACEALAQETQARSLLLNNGVDHSEHQPELPRILEWARKAYPHYAFKIASFEEYVEAVRRDLAKVALQTHEGELSYPFGDLLHGVYSARVYLKIANQRAEDLLEKHAEPLAALAWAVDGTPYPQDQLWYAWRELMKNHPHDDINGCSVDAVHDDMDHRFRAVDMVGQAIARTSLRALARTIDNTSQEGVPVCVFNPLGFARNEIVTIAIDLAAAYEPWETFALYDEAGHAVPFERIRQERVAWMEVLKGFDVERHSVQLELELPPCGYRTLYVRPGEPAPVKRQAHKIGARTFENAFYRLSFGADGTARLEDKATKARYDKLLVFEDIEDCGDAYTWSYLREHSETLTTAGAPATVDLIHRSALTATWRITHRLDVPAALTADRSRRAKKRVTLEIVSEVTCRADSPRVDVVTRLTNTACDHRLRVLFPTGIEAAKVHVDGHFGVIAREVALPPAKENLPPYPLQHQGRFVDITDGRRGFGIINLGLPEFEPVPGKRGVTLALTLFRAMDSISRNDYPMRPFHVGPPVLAPGAQCLRAMESHYAFMAHRGDWATGGVLNAALAHNVPLAVSRCDVHGGTDARQIGMLAHDEFMCNQPMRPVPRDGALPDRASLIDIGDPALVLSALKRCEKRKSLIVRVYNPGVKPVRAVLKAARPIRRAYFTDLNERRIEPAPIARGSVSYTCGASKIVTIELVL